MTGSALRWTLLWIGVTKGIARFNPSDWPPLVGVGGFFCDWRRRKDRYFCSTSSIELKFWRVFLVWVHLRSSWIILSSFQYHLKACYEGAAQVNIKNLEKFCPCKACYKGAAQVNIKNLEKFCPCKACYAGAAQVNIKNLEKIRPCKAYHEGAARANIKNLGKSCPCKACYKGAAQVNIKILKNFVPARPATKEPRR